MTSIRNSIDSLRPKPAEIYWLRKVECVNVPFGEVKHTLFCPCVQACVGEVGWNAHPWILSGCRAEHWSGTRTCCACCCPGPAAVSGPQLRCCPAAPAPQPPPAHPWHTHGSSIRQRLQRATHASLLVGSLQSLYANQLLSAYWLITCLSKSQDFKFGLAAAPGLVSNQGDVNSEEQSIQHACCGATLMLYLMFHCLPTS